MHLDHHHATDRSHRPSHHGPPGLMAGLIIVSVGIFFFLREQGLIAHTIHLWQLWPLFLVGFGVTHLLKARGLQRVVFALALLVFGAALLLQNLGVIGFGVTGLWPLAVIAAGVLVVWHGYAHPRRARTEREQVSEDTLNYDITMSGLEIKVDSKRFNGGELSVTMAGIEIDMRQAMLADGGATLNIRCVMGGIELRVPTTWRVINDVTPTLGGVEDTTSTVADAVDSRPTLTIRGTVLFGALTIKN